MAGRRKDVELVVRAKDEASKAVSAITGAITDLVSSQSDLTSSADKSDSALNQLGSAFGKLNKELRGFTVGAKLESEFKKAEGAIKRLSGSLKSSLGESTRIEQEITKAATAYDKLSASADKAKASLDREKAAKTANKAAQTAANAALRAGISERNKLATAEKNLGAAFEKQQGNVREATERYARLGEEIEQAESPTKRLTQTWERAGTSLDKAKAKLTGLEDKLAKTRAATADSASNMRVLQGAADDAAQGFIRQGAAVDKAQAKYSELAGQTKTAGQFLAKLREDSDKVKDSIAKQRGELAKASTEYQQFGAAVGKVEVKLAELGQAVGAGLTSALAEQTAAVSQAKSEWNEAQQSVLKLSRDIDKLEQTAANSIFGDKAAADAREVAVAWDEARVAADRSEKEFIAQNKALKELSAITRETGGDIDELATRQKRFAEVQSKTAKELLKIRAAADQNVAALRREAQAADKASGSNRRLGSATNGAAGAMRNARSAGEALGNAYKRLYGDSRRALSIQQRIRGEVLALTSSYLGLFAALQGIRGIQSAFEDLQAAQVKLGVVFEGDQIAREVQVARDSAARLGFEFGSLANSYANLQIATSASNVSADDTRKLFLSISNAARVLQLDNERLKRTFTAFSQIAQKGVVSMEELRQQLSENFPGSIEIFANAAGYATDELDKFYAAVARGEISADILGAVADGINDKFSGQLEESLDTISVAFGRFRNAVFEAAVTIGEAGLIDSLKDLYNTLTEVSQTSEFQAFLRRVGQAVAGLIDGIAYLAENFDTVIVVLSALLGLKAAGFFLALGGGMLKAARDSAVFTAAMTGSTTALGRARLAFVALKVAMRAALISTGIGAVIVGLTILFGQWVTSVENSTRALETHEKIVQSIRGAYNAAAGDLDKWVESINELSVTEARNNLDGLLKAIDETGEALREAARDGGGTFAGRFFGHEFNGASREYRNAVDEIIRKLYDGEIALSDLRGEFDSVNEQYRDGSAANKRLATALDETSAALGEQFAAAQEANDILISLTGTEEEQAAALARLAARYGEVRDGLDDTGEAARNFESAMDNLRKQFPKLNSEMSKFEKTAANIAVALEQAITAARALPDAIQRIAAEQAALQAANDGLFSAAQIEANSFVAGQTNGQDAAAAFLREVEGFISQAAFDVNAQRAGFGSDTITLADGSIHAITAGMRVSVEDANRDLARRISTEFEPIARNAVGADAFARLLPQQQAALTSIAYNYGRIPEAVANAVRGGSTEDVVAAIRSLGARGHAGTDLEEGSRRRTAREAALFGSTGNVEQLALSQQREAAALAETQRREEEKRLATQQEFRDGLSASLDQQQFELSIQQQGVLQQEVAKALREARLDAEAAGLELTEQQIARITEVTEARFREKAAQDAITASAEQAAEAEERVNALIARRSELQNQLAIFTEQGDTESANAAKTTIQEINTELGMAIENAIRMWEAIGGVQAEAAIEKLRTAALEARNLSNEGQQNIITWDQVGKVFGGRLLSAFDQFAQAVAEGKSIGEAARTAFLQFASDFLREIAQMIIKQAILNALRGLTGGGGFLGGIIAGLAHLGGVVGSKRTGSGNNARKVNPGIFASAGRFHEGGLPGLKTNEVATILKKGEEVVTEDDPRHIKNGAGQSAPAAPANVKVVNTFDAADMIDTGLQDTRGQEVFLNFMANNAAAVKAALGA